MADLPLADQTDEPDRWAKMVFRIPYQYPQRNRLENLFDALIDSVHDAGFPGVDGSLSLNATEAELWT